MNMIMNKEQHASKDYYADFIVTLLKNYELKQCGPREIHSLRHDIRNVVINANIAKVDIHDLFPITVNCGSGIYLKLYQNGEVYLFGNNHVSYLHGEFGDDDIWL